MQKPMTNAKEYRRSILEQGIAGNFPELIFYANEEPWKNVPYSIHGERWQTIGLTGCGPVSCANVVTNLSGIFVTPEDIAEFSIKNGHRTVASGSRWSLYKAVADHYGFTHFKESDSWNDLVDCISAGGYAICSMRNGFWGENGNCIFVWGYGKTHIYAVDPYNRRRRQHGIENFIPQCKRYFCYYPIGHRDRIDFSDKDYERIFEIAFQLPDEYHSSRMKG